MKMFRCIGCVAALAAAMSAADGSGNSRVRKDTPVELRLMREVSSASAKPGEAVEFEVLEAVMAGEDPVIARGAKAFGSVVEATPKGRLGRNGKLHLRIEGVCLRDGSVAALQALRGVDRERWESMQMEPSLGDAVMAIPAAPVLLFVQGKDVTIPRGREVTAYLSEDIEAGSLKGAGSCGETGPMKTAAAAVPTVTTAVVQIRATVDAADIYVGGKFAGSTPSNLRLPAGDHRIMVVKNGFKQWERMVWVSAGGEVQVTAALEEMSGSPAIGSFSGSKEKGK